jgi:hypothetical protein
MFLQRKCVVEAVYPPCWPWSSSLQAWTSGKNQMNYTSGRSQENLRKSELNRYLNLDIDLLDYERVDGREFLRARVASSPVGEQRDSDALRRPFPSRLRERILKLERRELHIDELILLGEELASLLLPPAVRDFYKRSLEKLRDDEGLRVRIRPHEHELAALPWEYVYVKRPDVPRGRKGPEGFLALDRKLSIVRYEIMEESSISIQPMKHHDIRTIALLSDVKDTTYAELDLDREELNLRQALEGFGGIDTRFLRPGTNVQLQEMLTEDAQVFHFSGHGVMERQKGEEPGTVEGQLIFSGDNHSPDPVDVGTLGLELRGKGIRLVVLNACEAAKRDPVTPWAGIASALVRQGIPAVVGMQYTIGDSSAIAFSRRFYRTLANGESIDSALSEGRLGILARSGGEERDWGVPVLYMRSSPSVLFPPPIVPFRRNLALLTATILLLSSWFFLHIYPWAADGTSDLLKKIGLGAGAVPLLFAVWKMIGTYAAKTAKSERGSIIERWLRHRRAKGVLISLLVASALLFSTTGSIYLSDDSLSGNSVKLSVQTSAETPFPPLPELTTSESGGKLGGGPFFLFPPPGELKLELVEPTVWSLKEDKSIRPRPWRSVKLSVTEDFEAVELRALRLAPPSSLIQLLPPKDQQTEKTVELRISIGGKPYIVPDLRQGVVLLGGPEALLRDLINKESDNHRNAGLRKCLTNPGSESQMKSKWSANIEILKTDFIKPGETVTFEVIDLIQPELSFSGSISTGKFLAGSIITECLERQRP